VITRSRDGNAQYSIPRFACGKSPAHDRRPGAWLLQDGVGKAANAGSDRSSEDRDVADSANRTGLSAGNGVCHPPRRVDDAGYRQRSRRRYFQAATTTPAASRCGSGWRNISRRAAQADATRGVGARAGITDRETGGAVVVVAAASQPPPAEGDDAADFQARQSPPADVVRGKVRATGKSACVGRHASRGAQIGRGHQLSAVLFDRGSRASRCYGVDNDQSAGTTVSGDLGGYRTLDVTMTQMIRRDLSTRRATSTKKSRGRSRERRRFHAFMIEPERPGRDNDHDGKGHAVSVGDPSGAHEIADADFRFQRRAAGVRALCCRARRRAGLTYRKVMIRCATGSSRERIRRRPNADGYAADSVPRPPSVRETHRRRRTDRDGLARGRLQSSVDQNLRGRSGRRVPSSCRRRPTSQTQGDQRDHRSLRTRSTGCQERLRQQRQVRACSASPTTV